MLDLRKNILLNNNKNLVISKGYVADSAQLVHFLNAVGGETDYLTFGLNEFHLSIEEEKLCISQCLELNQCLMLIGKIENEIVSQIYLDRSNNSRLSHIGDIGVTVKKQYWGNSIGYHMMLAAILWAKENGITKLQLQVRTDNAAAIYLYKKLGFCIEGVITQAIKINKIYFDNYSMGLIVD